MGARLTRRTRRLAVVVGVVAAVVMGAPAAAAPTATDVIIFIGASATPVPSDRLIPPTPNGGTKSIASLKFFALPHVANTGPEPATFRVRFELASGLRFATGRPDVDAESCSATTTVAACSVTDPLPPGAGEAGWQWEVVADQAGSYALKAEILDLSTTDPAPADNTTTITVVLSGSTGGGGGGSDAVSTSAVRLTPSTPRAGSAIAATVLVSAGGVALRPTRIACSGRIGALNLRGTPRAASGRATCTFRTPASAKGRVLRGSISFTARGQRVTKRFSVRLR